MRGFSLEGNLTAAQNQILRPMTFILFIPKLKKKGYFFQKPNSYSSSCGTALEPFHASELRLLEK